MRKINKDKVVEMLKKRQAFHQWQQSQATSEFEKGACSGSLLTIGSLLLELEKMK